MDPISLVKHALALRQRGDLAAAISSLRLADSGTTPEVEIALSGMLAEAGHLEEAETRLRAATERWPTSTSALYNLAKVVRDQGRAAEAVDLYARVVQSAPQMNPAWRNLGNVLIDLGRIDEAVQAYERAVQIKRALSGPASKEPEFRTTSLSKLRHDIEQFEHLASRGIAPERMRANASRYSRVLQRMRASGDRPGVLALPDRDVAEISSTYNRLVHRPVAPRLAGSALNPAIDWRSVERDYAERRPGVTWIDGLLKIEALTALRQYCLDATVWFSFRYSNGYLGAFMEDGFATPLLLQVAEELRTAAPAIFRHHTLRKFWAYKYDARLQGIPAHADFAAVNVNFWITPDSSCLDEETGGLIVWDKEAPADWDFPRYNADEAAIAKFLRDTAARQYRVPHRQNRALIFNSDLFHRTDDLAFRPGYANRRINITMLYGKRTDTDAQIATPSA